jgi:hypothetical protein
MGPNPIGGTMFFIPGEAIIGMRPNGSIALAVSAITFCLLFSAVAYAHQPRIVSQQLTIVENPEVSQAFYGELKGVPASFRISSDQPFQLYVQLLVPDIPGVSKDISAEVSSEKVSYKLDGTGYNWTSFYEEFAGDYYYGGPELNVSAEAGDYDIVVYSKDNEGKYVFVVGQKEEFPLKETINTIFVLPKIKQDFFGKPAYTAFFNMIGLFIFGSVILAAVAIIAAIFLIRRYRRKHRK